MDIDTPFVLKRAERFVRRELENDSSGHDWWHICRVRRTAVEIGSQEKADLFVVQLAALLHDIDDYKVKGCTDLTGPTKARTWLEGIRLDSHTVNHVCKIIIDMSFKGVPAGSTMTTKEGMVVQDADRLDALGAIGIARTFAYGGSKGRKIYDPDIQPRTFRSFEDYRQNSSPSINHFYEKLLRLRDLMNTDAGKRIAVERHKFMETFLERFFEEWSGEDSFELRAANTNVAIRRRSTTA